jgi:hypothetical protein
MSELFTRDRPIAKSLQKEEIWNDVPHKIGQAMGGREWFFEEECTALHRVGIGLGLGWRLPAYKQRGDGIDLIRVALDAHGTLAMQFLHCGGRPPSEADTVRTVERLQYRDLRATYERVMYEA